MSCVHRFRPIGTTPFQLTPGAAWETEFCKCGATQHHLFNPCTGPITVEQPQFAVGLDEDGPGPQAA